MSVRAWNAKRKEPDEVVVDLFRNVSLSPTKKVRVADSWVPANSWPIPSFEYPKESDVAIAPAAPFIDNHIPESPSPSSPSVATANSGSGVDEKAIILYKPVNPPLFPGGPPTGSSELPFLVDTTGILSACKGTGNNGSSVGAGPAFANSSPDAHTWTGLFEALDLQGGKPLLPIKRLQRTSSCSSLPRVPVSMDDSSMEEETDSQTSGGQLALIPYSPPNFVVSSANTAAQAFSQMGSSFPGGDSNEEMVDDGDAMDVMEESAPAGGAATESSSQFGSPIPTFGSAQWEPCEMFKAPYSKVMWSH